MAWMKQVFLGLGGNIGNTQSIFESALQEIAQIEGVFDLQCSSFYQTSPVSSILQPEFLNAVCSFFTVLSPKELFQATQAIEKKLGKVPKPKEAPRVIDLDILFFGSEVYSDDELQIPHPRWAERRFVLVPLSELIEEIDLPGEGNHPINIKKMLDLIPSNNTETIKKVNR